MDLITPYIHKPIFIFAGAVTARCITGIFIWKIFETVRGKDKTYRLPLLAQVFADSLTIAGGIYTYIKLT